MGGPAGRSEQDGSAGWCAAYAADHGCQATLRAGDRLHRRAANRTLKACWPCNTPWCGFIEAAGILSVACCRRLGGIQAGGLASQGFSVDVAALLMLNRGSDLPPHHQLQRVQQGSGSLRRLRAI